jgi:hypothetical protein
MSYFKNFFRFPSVEADLENEWVKKQRTEQEGSEIQFNVDYVICITEISPENEVMSIAEAWYPTEESYNDVKDTNKFPCTKVTFSIDGDYIINWPIKEFKKKWSDFKENLPESKMEIVHLNGKEEIQQFLNQLIKKEDE